MTEIRKTLTELFLELEERDKEDLEVVKFFDIAIDGYEQTKNKTYITEQPDPIHNNSKPIVDLVMEDMQTRKKIGIERYGVPLQANNGRDALRDAYEEALDLAIYLRQAIEERSEK